MNPMKRRRDSAHRVLPRAAAVALAVAGFSSSIVVASSASGATGPRAKSLVISTEQSASNGTILVSGTTVYTLKASKTPCAAKCLKIWPDVLLPRGMKKAKAGSGVNATKLGTVKRKGGALQVTYAGKALYWFSFDTAPGQVTGNITDTWGTWSVVVISKPANASLQPAPGTASIPTTTTTSATSPTSAKAGTGSTPAAGTMPPSGPTPTAPPTTMPMAPPAPPTTTLPPPTTTAPPTTTTPGGGGVGF
jgi:predicted lipoprotein with Yx(FWY)xxD motif